MSSKDAFWDHLKRKQAAPPGPDWPKLRDEFLDDVRSLLEALKTWLEDGVQQGLIRVDETSLRLEEMGLDPYDAPGLRLTVENGSTVDIRPVGCRVFGAAGRVDVASPVGEVALLLTGSKTWTMKVEGTGSFIDLNQDVFFEVLRGLVG